MKVASLEIELLANIARLQNDMTRATGVVSKSMGAIEKSVEQAKRVMGSLGMGLGLGAAVSQVIMLSDSYTKFTAQLKLATRSQQEYAQAYSDVQRISKVAQADLGATGVLYARVANGTRELGIGMGKVAQITEATNLALKVSGATIQESASATLQLSQAFASGTLRGEEFNAVNEAAPRLMKALADGMNVPVGALREMATEGKITSQVMAEALPKALADLREEAKSVQTIGGAFTLLKNQVLELVGTQAQASGFVSTLTSGIGLLANNLQLLAGAIGVIGAAQLAQWLKNVTVRTYESVTANQARLASTVAASQADVAATAATIAHATAAQGGIVIAREEMMARLAGANANITSARASLVAAEAVGAHSFALRAQRIATADLAVAEVARSASLAALATLGRQQASVSAQIIAATTAEATAKTGLAAANSAASVGARALSSVMGLFGGPVGLLTVAVIGGAAAWMSYKESADKVRGSLINLGDPLDQVREKFEKLTQLEQARALDGLRAQIEESAAAMKESLRSLESVPLKLRVSPDFADFKNQIQAVTKSDIGADDLERKLTGLVTGFLATVPGAASARDAVEGFANEAIKAARATEQLAQRQDALAPKVIDTAGAMNKLAMEAAKSAAGLDTKKWIEHIEKLESAAAVVGMSAGQLAEYAAQSLGASSMQSQLAGVLAASAEAAKALEKATADKDSKAIKGANDLLGALVAQEVQLRVNVTQASAYAALLAMGLSQESAMQGAQTEGELVGLRDLDGILARIAAVRKNVAENTELSTKATNAATKALSNAAKAAADFVKEQAKELDGIYNNISAIQDQAQVLEDQIATYGMGKAAIEALTIARLEEQKTILGMYGDAANPAVQAIEAEIEARKRLMAATANKEALDANTKAAEQAQQEWERTNEKIGQDLTDALMRGFESGKSFAENFRDTLKNMFKTLILQPILQPIMSNVAGGIQGMLGMGGGATGSSSGGMGNIGGLLNNVSSLNSAYGALSQAITGATAGASTASLAYANVVGMMGGDSIGALIASNGGWAGASAGASGAAAGSAAAGGAGGGAAGGMSLMGPLAIVAAVIANSALYKQGWDANNGSMNTGVGAVFGGATGSIHKALEGLGMSGYMASMLSGSAITSRLFGLRNKEYGDTSIAGSFGASGFAGSMQMPWSQKGGVFRSDKDGVDYGAVPGDLQSSLSASFVLMKAGIMAVADSVGVASESLGSYSEKIKITLTSDAEKNQELIASTLSSVGENMVRTLIPTIADYARESETASQTLQRLSASLATANIYLKQVQKNLLDVSLAGADAAAKLGDVFGGLDKLGEATQAFYMVAFSESERATHSLDGMRVALQSVGMSMPRTVLELRDMAMATDLMTDAGRSAYAALIAIAPEFAAVAEATKRLAEEMGARMLESFTARGQLVAALDVTALKTMLLRDTLVSTYVAAGNISTLFLDLKSGLISFGGSASVLDGEMTGAQVASAMLADQIAEIQAGAAGATIDFAKLTAQLDNIDTNVFVATITKAFDVLAQRISSLIGDIASERIAVREAAREIIDPGAMTPDEIRRQIAGINTTLPGSDGVVAAGMKLSAADAGVASARAAMEASMRTQQAQSKPMQSLYGAAPDTWVTGQTDNTIWEKVLGDWNEKHLGVFGRYMDRPWDADQNAIVQKQKLDAEYAAMRDAANADISAKNAVAAASNAAYAALAEQAQAQLDAATAAQNTAALDASKATTAYADAMQDFAIDAGKSVGKLSTLREETMRYYQAQKQLADLMGTSAAGLRKTAADYRYGQLDPEDQLNKLQADYAKAYAMALSTDGDVLVGYADQMNSMLNPMLEKARDVFGSDSEYNAFVATMLARAENIAGRLDILAPADYEDESLALLGQIDATLVALEASSRTAEQLVVNAINAGRDATVDALRHIASALGWQGIPAFASGGDHLGGLRLVGERGPELEATGPSRIFTASQTRSILGGGGNGDTARLEALVERLIQENADLRIEVRSIAVTNDRLARQGDRQEIEGVLVRTDAEAPLDIKETA